MVLTSEVSGETGGVGAVEAVSSSQDPAVVDQRASAEMSVGVVQTDLPGPRPRSGVLTAHDLGVERRGATNWTETVRMNSPAAGRCSVSLCLDLSRFEPVNQPVPGDYNQNIIGTHLLRASVCSPCCCLALYAKLN